MRYALIILAFLFCTIKTEAQVYQSMPQAGYGPVKRMLIDSVLTIPIGISALRNITGGRDTAQIRYQKSDSSVYVYTGSTWVKLGTGGGGGGSADSTVFFTVYRADTMRANIYATIPQPDTIYARYPVRISNDTIYLQQAFVDSVYAGGGGNFVPYTGATQDVDLGARKLAAASIFVEGTNGNGHIHLKHQNGDATATGNSTSLYADTNGDIKWKNDGDYYTTLATSGNTANRVYTFMDTTGRVVVLDSGRLILRPIANNGTLNNSLQLANRDGRSYFNISTNSNVTNLTIKANTNAVLDSFVIADSGLIAPRTNATMWLRPTQTGNNNIVANRCAGCGTGSIFSANVGTSAPIFNMLSTGQMSINGETPASTAALDITSTSRGLLIPRMTTTQRNAISTPATGLMVWNTTDTTLNQYTGNRWRPVANTDGQRFTDSLVLTSTVGGVSLPNMTQTQMNAIVPRLGTQVYNTTYDAVCTYTNDFGWWSNDQLWMTSNGMMVMEDFITYPNASTGNGYLFQNNLTGGTIGAATPISNRPGILQLSTSTSATGRAAILSDANVSTLIVGGGKLIFESDVQIPTLSSSAQTFMFSTGFSGSGVTTANNAIYFLYDSAGATTGSAAIGRWQVVCSNGSTRTYTTTDSTVTAGRFYRLRFEVNAAGTSVAFYINGTLVKTETNNIPTGNLTPVATILKSNGTTARTALIDYIRIRQKFTTPR